MVAHTTPEMEQEGEEERSQDGERTGEEGEKKINREKPGRGTKKKG